MRVAEIRVIHARIPLKRRVRHASHSRTENETILVRCRMSDGSIGWGEGLPRPYVTGETIDSAWQHLQEYPYSSLGQKWESPVDLTEMVHGISFPRPSEARSCFGNAARCALELAVLDAGCRSLGRPLSSFLQQLPFAPELNRSPTPVFYSAALTAAHPLKVWMRSWLYRHYGFRQCKVKVGVPGQNDQQLLQRIHRILGPKVALRIDANEAWNSGNVVSRLAALRSVPLQSVEQPIPHAEVSYLRELRRQISQPIMLDESLCSLEDANRAIDQQLCDAFNLRLSKCGGLLACLQLMQLAREAGLSCQLGCQVGETGILSAAGRHFACTVSELTAVEGSFDRLLVREPLTEEDLTFSREGRGEPLTGSGLGITIREQDVQRVTVRTKTFPIS